MNDEELLKMCQIMNVEDLNAFKSMTSRNKVKTILADIKKYVDFSHKRNKNQFEKDRHFFESRRYYMKARDELDMLDSEQQIMLAENLTKLISSAIVNDNYKSFVSNFEYYDSVLIMLKSIDTPEVVDKILRAQEELQEYKSMNTGN